VVEPAAGVPGDLVVTAVLAAVLAGSAAALVARRRPRRTPSSLLGRAPVRVAPEPRSAPAPQAACAVAALAALVLLPRVAAVAVALGLVLAGPRLLAGLDTGTVRREREQLSRDLPLLLDLLAACLAGGAALPAAACAVGAAVPGPAGDRLGRVAAALAVGTPADLAWRALADDDVDDPLGGVARALARSAETGAPVAAALAGLAAEARRESRAAGTRAARRAGVLAVAPLGLCFLPAFVLLGVLPVVVGLAAPVLRAT
jgi:pilus assembly protein TadC